jgi:hypothetical protein
VHIDLIILCKETQNLVGGVDAKPAQILSGKKLEYLWKDEAMQGLIQQLPGHWPLALDTSSVVQILTVV